MLQPACPRTTILLLNGRAYLTSLALLLLAAASQAQTTYTWNGSAGTAWNNAANWTPNTGFPLATDNATIVSTANAPVLDVDRTVNNLTMTSGTLNLNGRTLTSTNNGTFNGGAVNNGTFAPNSASGVLNFGATTFGAVVSGQASDIRFTGATFNAAVTLEKTGSSYDYSSGNNTFNAPLNLTVSNGRSYLAYNGTTLFNANVTLNCNGAGGGIWFGQSAGTATLAAGRTLTTSTFSTGSLLFRNFTQVGATPQTLTLTGTSTLYFQLATTFNADLAATTPGLYLNGTTFNGASKFTKTGSNSEFSSGGNTFNGTVEYTVAGTGSFYPANSGVDLYNQDLRLNTTSTGGINFGNSSGTSTLASGRSISVGSAGFSGGSLRLRNFTILSTAPQTLTLGAGVIYTQQDNNTFNGDLNITAGRILLNGGIVHGAARYTKLTDIDDWGQGGCDFRADLELVNNSAGILALGNSSVDLYGGNLRLSNSSTGSLRFGYYGGGGVLAAGRTITIGSGGYDAGLLLFERFTQLGTTPLAFTLGTSARLYIRDNCTFEAPLTLSAGGFVLARSNFRSNCSFTKTGTIGESSPGGNTFDGDLHIALLGTGNLNFANDSTDYYKGDVVVESQLSGDLRFGNNQGGAVLSDGRTISVGPLGFGTGLLGMRKFYQLGTTPQQLLMPTGGRLYFLDSCRFEGPVTASSAVLYARRSVFQGACSFTKTGTGNDGSAGGNTFEQDLELLTTNTGGLFFGETYVDQYNGNVRLNSLSSGDIRFGNNGAGGGQLAAGRTISIGSQGFGSGVLGFRNFTQLGTTPQQLLAGPQARLYFYGGNQFNGDLTATSGSLYISQSTFNGITRFTKNDATGDVSPGGNLFAKELELTVTSTGYVFMGDVASDIYHGDVVLNNLAGGQIRFGNGGTATSTMTAGNTVRIGSGGFTGGVLMLRAFVQEGSVPMVLPLSISTVLYFNPGADIGGPVTATTGSFYLSGATFRRNGKFIKTGPNGDHSSGGCTYHGDMEFVNQNTGYTSLGYNTVDNFLGNLVLNNTSTGSFYFGWNTGGATLAAGRTISVGALGFDAGLLQLRGFTQLGGTPQTLLLGNAANLTYNTGTTFNGDITSVSGRLIFQGATFNGRGNFTKTNGNGDGSTGGSIFNGYTEFSNLGTGGLYLAQIGGTDQYNGDVRVNNTSTGVIYFATSTGSAVLAAGRTIAVGSLGFPSGTLLLRSFTQLGPTPQNLVLGTAATLEYGTGCVFNGPITSTSGRLYFNGSTFHANGEFTKTANIGDGSGGGNVFNGTTDLIVTSTGNLSLNQNTLDQFNGNIRLHNPGGGQISFGQGAGSATLANGRTIAVGSGGFDSGTLLLRNFTQVGGTPQVLAMGSSSLLYFQTGTTFNGDLTTTSGRLFLNGATFNNNSRFTKTGLYGDGSTGGNTFAQSVELTLTSTGTISMYQSAAPDVYNGNILLNNTSTGQIQFGQSTAVSNLAAGHTIAVGALGFNSGILLLRNFTQLGGTAQNLALGSGATLYYQGGTTFNGNITSTSGGLYFNGTTFNGTGRFTKTGTSSDAGTGNNFFNGNTEITVTSTGILYLHNVNVDEFNGNLLLNNTSTGTISFGNSTGSSTLAAGRTIAVGALGFNAGTLNLRRFTQLGTTAQVLQLGQPATLNFVGLNSFGGDLTAVAGNLYVNGSTFNGNNRFTKTGTANNTCTGGNLYGGLAEFTNTNTGVWYIANTGSDIYNGDVALANTSTGTISIGNSTGTSTMHGGALRIGSAGFTAGALILRNFTKIGTATSVLNGATGATTALTFAANNVFNGTMTASAANLYLNGSRFNDAAVFNKTGTTANSSTGPNVFNGDVEINASGGFTMATGGADDFNGNATFRRLSTGTFIVNNSYNANFSRNVNTVGSTGGSVQFGATSSRTIFDGTTVQTFNSDAANPPSVRNLTLAMTGAGELQLLGTVNVTNDVAFTTGVVKPSAATSTSNGLLILAHGSTISDAADPASYVDGFVRKIGNTAFSFPVGQAGVLAPVRITAPGATTHHFTAKYVHHDTEPSYDHNLHDATLDHISRCEYWILDRTNSTTNVTVTLSYDGVNSCGVTDLGSLAVARWNGSMWKDHGNGGVVGNLSAGTISTAGVVTAFSPFTLASRTGMNPLPIELLSFTAANDGDRVLATWATATETNNDRFELERSADAQVFERIGTVPGAGNSQSQLQYAFADESPLGGISYYRLKQVDYDGQYSYSDVVAVQRDAEDRKLQLWPNPVVDQLTVRVPGTSTPNAVMVHDAAGRLVLERDLSQLTGTVDLDMNGTPAGILFVTVFMADGQVLQERIVKL